MFSFSNVAGVRPPKSQATKKVKVMKVWKGGDEFDRMIFQMIWMKIFGRPCMALCFQNFRGLKMKVLLYGLDTYISVAYWDMI